MASAWRAVLVALALAACAGPAPLYPPKPTTPLEPVDWLSTLESRIPPLKHERGRRWPLVLWNGPGFEPLPPETIGGLLARGIVPHIRLDEASIPAAKALQAAGAPVIAVEGKGGNWPYSLGGDPETWAHRYPEGKKIPEEWRAMPSPMIFKGWAVAEAQIRQTLSRFKDAGVVLDAAWLDWEVEPHVASFKAAIESPSSRALLPAPAAADGHAFMLFRHHLWMGLMSAYVAAPIREANPKVSVTNWMAVLSSEERPVPTWTAHALPPTGPSLMTATNPTAYGVDLAFLTGWDEDWPLDRDHVDRFYMQVLLRQVSADSHNRRRIAPYLESLPWVARWVRIADEERKPGDPPLPMVPAMSREAYREALRHLWLRGIDGMQVFNSPTTSDNESAIAEVEDAAAVYDEMLAFREFLEQGDVMNLDHPDPGQDGPIWSGLRTRDRALLRVFPGGGERFLEIEAWPGAEVSVPLPPEGATYRLRRAPEGGIELEAVR
ncbi:MAG: hypothetical protein H7841_04305 [Magnetospirillum sp. WYHS-4]